MGAEFIRNAAPSFKKGWDRGRVRLGTADLFTRQPTTAPRIVDADVVGDVSLNPGDNLIIRKVGETLIAARGLTEVARFNDPPADIMRAVQASCGVASGTVETFHKEAGVVEIAIC
jgi:hypothetical protein